MNFDNFNEKIYKSIQQKLIKENTSHGYNQNYPITYYLQNKLNNDKPDYIN